MAIYYTLQQNNIKSSKYYGMWYAHAKKQGELNMNKIEQLIQNSCTVTKADIRAVLAALREVVEDGLKDGKVVNLGELGKLYLGIQSECVTTPSEFLPAKHIKRLVCKYSPEGHRSNINNRRLVRPFTCKCEIREQPYYNTETYECRNGRKKAQL